MGEIGCGLHGLALICGPSPLIVMQVSSLDDIYLIFIHQVLQMIGQSCNIGVLHIQRRVEGPMNTYDNPLNVGVAASIPQVLLQIIELLTAQVVSMLRGKVNDVNLTIIKGKPKISLFGVNLGQHISLHIGGIVIVALVVADSRHEGGICCEFRGQFTKQVPNWFQLAKSFLTHSSIGNISSQENKVVWSDEVVLDYLVRDECSEGGVGAHISKNGNVDFFQGLDFKWGRFEILRFRENSGFCISHSIIISLQWLHPFDYGSVNPTMEPQMANIVSDPCSLHHSFQLSGQSSELNDWLIVEFGTRCPHHLHLTFNVGQANMYLFWTCLGSHLYF